MMIDNTLPILLQDAETVSVGAIQKMYSLDSLIHEVTRHQLCNRETEIHFLL